MPINKKLMNSLKAKYGEEKGKEVYWSMFSLGKVPGERTYKKPVKPCPGSKIRSKGMGRGLGVGKGKGPLGKPRANKKPVHVNKSKRSREHSRRRPVRRRG